MKTRLDYQRPGAPGMLGEPWPDRRAIYARVLRTARRLRKRANTGGEGFPVGAYFLGVQAALSAGKAGWWRWADDLAKARSPLDYTPAARYARSIEFLARCEDQSIWKCHLGECPPLPAGT